MKLISFQRFALVVAVVALSATPAQAGIMADLNAMFLSNATGSSTLSSRDRVGAFGGSFVMRTPIQNVNVIAFDPPRLNAGCGGVDLYGGSFSFLNADALIAVFRAVAANAAGLAFKAAIKMISPSLDQLISEFQALLQKLNNLAKNSCALAHLVVDKADAAISDAIDGDGNVGAADKGMFSDAMASLSGFLADANDYLSKAGSVNPRTGNQIIKAIVASGASATLGYAGLSNIDGTGDDPSDPNSLNNRLLYSITGYEIAGVPCGSENDAGDQTTTLNVSSNNMPRISCSSPAQITLADLIKGGGPGSEEPDKPLQLYKCLNPSGSSSGGFDPQICSQMQVTNFNYVGIRGWVNTMLFGTPQYSGVGSVTPSSIVGQFNSGSSVTLSSAQVLFARQAGNRLIALLSKTNNPEARYAIAHRLGQNITECIAAKVGESLYVAANNIQANNSYKFSDDQKAAIRKLETDTAELKKQCLHDETVAKIIVELNESAKLSNTSNR